MVERPKRIFESLEQSNTQVWTSTPSFVQMCLMDPSFKEKLLPHISVFLFCGEILPVQIAQQLIERFPKAKVFNTYGPTEATVAVTFVELTDHPLNHYTNLPVGKTKKDTKILLLNEDGNEVLDGEKGEIVIVGTSVSKGYLDEPDRTEKVFYLINGQMAYRTGMPDTWKMDFFSIKDGRTFKLNYMGIG